MTFITRKLCMGADEGEGGLGMVKTWQIRPGLE